MSRQVDRTSQLAERRGPKPALANPTHTPANAHVVRSGTDRLYHDLVEHLQQVAKLASQFAANFDSARWAHHAGMLHDLGKFQPAFQKYLDALGEATKQPHAAVGARYAMEAHPGKATPLAFAIAGHHAGLADADELKNTLNNRDSAARLKAALVSAPRDLLSLVADTPDIPAFLGARAGEPEAERLRREELWCRFLFSALCDADFLDTESFFAPAQNGNRAASFSLNLLKQRLDHFLDELKARATQNEINRIRDEVLVDCRDAAMSTPGVFTLTVPTGGGKTLSSMAFALDHAVYNNLRRVIVVLPYTAIIEQNAAVYRQALDPGDSGCVLEHHSSFDPWNGNAPESEAQTPRHVLAAENWDAPVIVTTTVQFFESLFANRPSKCRKLHNIARSVVILDEAQTFPPGLLQPIVDALRTLATDYGCTIVISTATQPALERVRVHDSLAESHFGIGAATEIVRSDRNLATRLRRVRVRWPRDTNTVLALDELASQIEQEPCVLAIVHSRRDARELVELLDKQTGTRDTFHLSALMCPEHRSDVIARIRRALAERGSGTSSAPVRVVRLQKNRNLTSKRVMRFRRDW